MSDSDATKLNIDLSLPGAEDRLVELQKLITAKLTDGYGYELQDDTLATWIIMVAVRNNSTKGEVSNDLVEFIQENSSDFVDWLWKEASRICNPPKEVKKPETTSQAEKAKVKPPVNTKNEKTVNQADSKDKKPEQTHNSVNLMKKAIDDTKKTHRSEPKRNERGNNASSYVKTDKDGRKVISLNKSGANRVEEQDRPQRNYQKHDRDDRKHHNKHSSSSVFERLNKKDPEADKDKSNLDMDLESVIKKQKQKETEKTEQDWYPGSRKRPHHHAHMKYEKEGTGKHHIEEVDVEAKDDNQHGMISLSQKNNNLRNKRAKVSEEVEEVEEGEGNTEGYRGGYKGKKPYFNPQMMGYMPPMYDFPPQMYMDPYMMYGGGGYMKPFKKKFKNKSLIVKKDEKGQKEAGGEPSTGNPPSTT